MGYHGICRNPFHYFSKEEKLVMVYDDEKGDWMLFGQCKNCGIPRIVYKNALKHPEVINTKLKNGYISSAIVPHPCYYST